MKFSANRKKLLEALAFVLPAVPARTPKLVLMNVRIRAADGMLTLDGTDLEHGIESRLPANVGVPGVVLLDAMRLNRALGAFAGEDIEFSLAPSGTCRLTAARAKVEMQTASEKDWVRFYGLDMQEPNAFEMDATRFRIAFGSCAGVTDEASARYALGGVLLEKKGKSAFLVGTDGSIMVSREIEVGGDREVYSVVPPKLARLMVPMNGKVSIQCSDNCVRIANETQTVASRLIEGRFPRWRDALECREMNGPIEIQSDALESACRLGAVGFQKPAKDSKNPETPIMDFTFGAGELTISSKQELGSGESVIPISYDGKPVTARLDAAYVADMLKACGLETLSVWFDDGGLCIRGDGLKTRLVGCRTD